MAQVLLMVLLLHATELLWLVTYVVDQFRLPEFFISYFCVIIDLYFYFGFPQEDATKDTTT